VRFDAVFAAFYSATVASFVVFGVWKWLRQTRRRKARARRPDWWTPDSVAVAAAKDYTVYTHQFDEVVDALALAGPDDNQRRQAMIDGLVSSAAAASVNRLAERASDALQNDNAAVTLLLDNSGSFYSVPDAPKSTGQLTRAADAPLDSGAALMATLVQALVAAAERKSVPIEVLGFTTVRWQGGLSRMQWLRDGRAAMPGRLNDIRHIEYKTFAQSVAAEPTRLAPLLDAGLFKENIDGEALAWAHSRLVRRTEQRRLLVLVSDGAPVDDSTLSCNDPSILFDHRLAVIAEIAARQDVELAMLCIGSEYYDPKHKQPHALIERLSDFDGPAFDRVLALFDKQAMRTVADNRPV
jgi:cobaltochelatase CobT